MSTRWRVGVVAAAVLAARSGLAAPIEQKADARDQPPVAAAERSRATDRAAVEAIEREWLAGLHDRATLERILADDFVHPVSAGMFLTKRQHIDWAVTHPAPPGIHQQFDTLDIRVYGNTAIATGTVRATEVNGHETRTVFTDVFVRRDGRWQAVSAQETAVD